MTSSCLLYYKGIKKKDGDYKMLAVFFMYVTFMQFWDFVFWKSQQHPTLNSIATKAAILWNNFQPVVLFLLARHFSSRQTKVTSQLSFYVLIGYMIASLPYTVRALKEIQNTKQEKTCEGDHGGCNLIVWQWNVQNGSTIVYALFLLSFCVTFFEQIRNINLRIASIVAAIVSFVFSTYKYRLQRNVGRMWCFFAAFMPALLLLL
jgi:hypothetical protein